MPSHRGVQPARSLYSKKVKQSLHANILSLIRKYDCQTLTCRASWGREDPFILQNISSIRMKLDDEISKLRDVQFFLSNITGTHGVNTTPPAPGIAYIIAWTRQSRDVSKEVLFALIQRLGADPKVEEISPKMKNCNAQGLLFQAVKDHNSTWARNLVTTSNKHCLETAQPDVAPSTDQFQQLLDVLYDRHLVCPTPSRMVVVNNFVFNEELEQSHRQLTLDGFKVIMICLHCLYVTRKFENVFSVFSFDNSVLDFEFCLTVHEES